MQMWGLITTAAIAVGGWIVAQYQARRATRRNTRITYLLEAYRRFEQVVNRPMTADNARIIEAAHGDIILLGSPDQVVLADTFAREYAAGSGAGADPGPLLENLRQSLRRELLLQAVPARRIWLRIEHEPNEPDTNG